MSDPAWVFDVYKIFQDLGVPVEVWVPIMLAESGANPGAVNDTRGQVTAPGTRPEYSIGLFQVNAHAMGLSDADEEKLAAQLKDPVFNASFHAPAIAAAWKAVSGSLVGGSRVAWAPAVAVQSGHPGGHPGDPCTTDHCNNVKNTIAGFAQRYIDATGGENGARWQGTDLLTPYWNARAGSGGGGQSGATGGQTSTGTNPNGPWTIEELKAAIQNGPTQAQLAAAWAAGITGGQNQSGGGGGASGGGSSNASAGGAGTTNAVASIATGLAAWWAANGLRLIVFLFGAAVFGLALAAIIFEQGNKATRAAVREVGIAAKAAGGNVGALAEVQ